MNAPAKRRRALSESEGAIAAAADKKLTDLKAERVARAEFNLNDAKRQLAEAEAAEVDLAARFAQNIGHRPALLEARATLDVARSMVDHFQRKLERARVRWTPEQTKAARDLIQAERPALP